MGGWRGMDISGQNLGAIRAGRVSRSQAGWHFLFTVTGLSCIGLLSTLI